VEFRILGPLDVANGAGPVLIGASKPRALLGVLLLHPNEAVSSERLIDELWGERPPATANKVLQTYISQLRRLLGADTIATRAPGYLLRIDEQALDATRFRRLVGEGRSLVGGGDHQAASERYREALALWRGPPLADVGFESFARSEVERLEDERLAAAVDLTDSELALGHHEEIIPDLETHVRQHPLHERLRAQLMLALYRSGRQADALNAYQDTRRTLVQELGLEPGRELQELEKAILTHDPVLDLPPTSPNQTAKQETEAEPSVPPLAAAASPREERKVVTVLFADLVGFTAQAERLDPEDVRAIQDRYWAPVRAEIERHGGTVEKFVGDAVMALFGAPSAHEDDPERAVRAALAIRDWARAEGIEVRIAVTTGEALVRLGARPLAGEGMAAGDVINSGARLQAAAPVNGVLVGDRTFRATKDTIDYQEREPVEARGRAEPLRVWEALQARSRLGVDIPGQWHTRLVGRERELELLLTTLARAREHASPQLVTLVGLPGIGKSRLVYELAQAIDADRTGILTWRQGRSLSYGDGVSFWALGEIVKAQVGILDSDGDAEAQAKLGRAAHAVIDDLSEAEWVERHMRPLAGLGGESEPPTDRSEASAAWRRFFEALADWRPLVLVFEDLHWADDGLLDFVESLIEWVSEVPLLIVATTRPELLERRPAWGGGKANATTLSLSPLSEVETAQLVIELVGGRQLPPATEEAMIAHVAGNPLYAEQYVRRWKERDQVEQLALPETVHDLIAARLDNLSPVEKSVLQNGAVFGNVFWQGAVVALDGVDSTTASECLHALQRKQFVKRRRRSSVEDESEYIFRHVLVRDVAYGQIPRAARADKHARAAAWIDSIGRAEDQAEMIAHHYLTAHELLRLTGQSSEELAGNARRALIQAGDRAFGVNAAASAAGYYEQALELLPATDPGRPHLQLAYARALFASSNDRRANGLEQARAALLAVGDIDSAAEVEMLLAEVVWYRDARRAAIDQHLERALGLIRDRPRSPSKAHVLAAAARFRMLAGDASAIQLAREALDLAQALDLHEVQAHVLITLGKARWNKGDLAGIADIERGLQLALEQNALSAALRGYSNLSAAMVDRGDEVSHLELLKQAERLAQRLGNPHQLRFVRRDLIEAEFVQGRWDEALRRADEFIAECEAGSAHGQEGNVRTTRAEIRFARDDVEGALADQERALAHARESDEPQRLLTALGLAIHLYVRLGRLAEARSLATEVLSYDRGLAPSMVATMLASHRHALGLSTIEISPYIDQIRGELPWHEVAELILREQFETAADRMGSLGCVVWEAETRIRAAEQFLERGRNDQANQQLGRALRFFHSVGATRYIRKAEALLARTHAEPETPTEKPRAGRR
jgi:predicted ATPase/DNA-binding SARP family transcriptional activator